MTRPSASCWSSLLESRAAQGQSLSSSCEVHAYNLWRHLISRRQRHVLTSGLEPVGNHYDLQSSYQIRSGVVARLFVGLDVLGACRSGFQQLA